MFTSIFNKSEIRTQLFHCEVMKGAPQTKCTGSQHWGATLAFTKPDTAHGCRCDKHGTASGIIKGTDLTELCPLLRRFLDDACL